MTTPDDLNQDFRDLLDAFVRHEVDFVIVGAYALALHGIPRATGDLDLLLRPTRENAEKAWSALREFGAPLEALGIERSDLTSPGTVIQIGLPPRRIDLLTRIDGVTFEEAWSSRVAVEVGDTTVHVLSRQTFVKNKRSLGRAQDLADIERIEREPPRG